MADAQPLGAGDPVALDPAVFEARFNGPLVHEVVMAELAARRQGTHATKTRGMVSGGSSKPWRQKGTGRARAGSTRAPQWTGGGAVFGPSPRHYTTKVNRKARRAALRAALSVHAARDSIAVLDPAAFTAPSTRQARELLEGRLGGALLVLLTDGDEIAAKSFRNLPGVGVLHVEDAGVADLIRAATLVATPAALESLRARAVRLERTVVDSLTDTDTDTDTDIDTEAGMEVVV